MARFPTGGDIYVLYDFLDLKDFSHFLVVSGSIGPLPLLC